LHLVSVVDLDAALGEDSSTSRWDNPKRRYRPTARTMTPAKRIEVLAARLTLA
jgi:hypothetical protein